MLGFTRSILVYSGLFLTLYVRSRFKKKKKKADDKLPPDLEYLIIPTFKHSITTLRFHLEKIRKF